VVGYRGRAQDIRSPAGKTAPFAVGNRSRGTQGAGYQQDSDATDAQGQHAQQAEECREGKDGSAETTNQMFQGIDCGSYPLARITAHFYPPSCCWEVTLGQAHG
jgi:hypothetical protein